MKTVAILICLISCTYAASRMERPPAPGPENTIKNVAGKDINARFAEPDSFKRIWQDSGSFGYYLRHLPLKADGALVAYFNGETKQPGDVYCAVVDMPISNKDLQQCADAVMRLRGEYLFSRGAYEKISFRFTGDGRMHGFKEYAGNDYSYNKFRKYMEYVFGYANTASLKKQLKPVPFSSMQIGDVLVQSGNPYGHAVIVVDICKNAKGEKMYMLAQSYMPAQETQILLSPGTQSPWYAAPERSTIVTPEWTFDTSDLRRW